MPKIIPEKKNAIVATVSEEIFFIFILNNLLFEVRKLFFHNWMVGQVRVELTTKAL